MHHPALADHGGAPPLGVLDGLHHPHQGDVGAGAGGGAEGSQERALCNGAVALPS